MIVNARTIGERLHVTAQRRRASMNAQRNCSFDGCSRSDDLRVTRWFWEAANRERTCRTRGRAPPTAPLVHWPSRRIPTEPTAAERRSPATAAHRRANHRPSGTAWHGSSRRASGTDPTGATRPYSRQQVSPPARRDSRPTPARQSLRRPAGAGRRARTRRGAGETGSSSLRSLSRENYDARKRLRGP